MNKNIVKPKRHNTAIISILRTTVSIHFSKNLLLFKYALSKDDMFGIRKAQKY
jgi:diketogulonate reductase-like aldo/keto reductase